MPIFYPNNRHFRVNVPSLAKVERNLYNGAYRSSPWRFIKNVNVAFEFLREKYPKHSRMMQQVNEVR